MPLETSFTSPPLHSVTHIGPAHALYPDPLRTLYDPPEELYLRGTLPSSWRHAIAVVGSRKMSPYGKQVINLLVPPLAAVGVPIVSGLAYGCDAAAHEATLAAHGTTIAVLGSGLDDASLYPAAHRGLATRILASGGALLSEYPPGTGSQKFHFPMRNRIIAGLSAAVLVIEAREKSGSLITAMSALEAGREVFAVPGLITSDTSAGTNFLIKHGAHPVTCPEDIFEILGMACPDSVVSSATPLPSLSQLETDLLALIRSAPRTTDELSELTSAAPSDLIAALSSLELLQLITAETGSWTIGALH